MLDWGMAVADHGLLSRDLGRPWPTDVFNWMTVVVQKVGFG